MAIKIIIPSRTGVESAAVSAIKERLYDAALGDIVIESTREERLFNDGGNVINELILHENVNPDSGVRISFDDCKIDVTQEKKIHTTPLVNRDGVVKEYINTNDYTITISGTIRKDLSGSFPYEDLWYLQQVLALNKKLYVSSRFLNIYDITQVVVKTIEFKQGGMKFFNVMPYTIKMESDMDYDFLVEE